MVHRKTPQNHSLIGAHHQACCFHMAGEKHQGSFAISLFSPARSFAYLYCPAVSCLGMFRSRGHPVYGHSCLFCMCPAGVRQPIFNEHAIIVLHREPGHYPHPCWKVDEDLSMAMLSDSCWDLLESAAWYSSCMPASCTKHCDDIQCSEDSALLFCASSHSLHWAGISTSEEPCQILACI